MQTYKVTISTKEVVYEVTAETEEDAKQKAIEYAWDYYTSSATQVELVIKSIELLQ